MFLSRLTSHDSLLETVTATWPPMRPELTSLQPRARTPVWDCNSLRYHFLPVDLQTVPSMSYPIWSQYYADLWGVTASSVNISSSRCPICILMIDVARANFPLDSGMFKYRMNLHVHKQTWKGRDPGMNARNLNSKVIFMFQGCCACIRLFSFLWHCTQSVEYQDAVRNMNDV
jgi:hypothetical protein